MFVTNWISTTKIQKISEITNFFRHYFLSRTEVNNCKGKKDIEQPMSDVQPFQEISLVAGEIVGQFYVVLKIGSMEIEHMLEA